jgi:hypothetical protein
MPAFRAFAIGAWSGAGRRHGVALAGQIATTHPLVPGLWVMCTNRGAKRAIYAVVIPCQSAQYASTSA